MIPTASRSAAGSPPPPPSSPPRIHRPVSSGGGGSLLSRHGNGPARRRPHRHSSARSPRLHPGPGQRRCGGWGQPRRRQFEPAHGACGAARGPPISRCWQGEAANWTLLAPGGSSGEMLSWSFAALGQAWVDSASFLPLPWIHLREGWYLALHISQAERALSPVQNFTRNRPKKKMCISQLSLLTSQSVLQSQQRLHCQRVCIDLDIQNFVPFMCYLKPELWMSIKNISQVELNFEVIYALSTQNRSSNLIQELKIYQF